MVLTCDIVLTVVFHPRAAVGCSFFFVVVLVFTVGENDEGLNGDTADAREHCQRADSNEQQPRRASEQQVKAVA